MIEEIKIDRLEELIHEMMIKIRNTSVTNSAEGNPIEIENAAAAPLLKCVSAITGTQNLNGYNKPWAGGTEVNKVYTGDCFVSFNSVYGFTMSTDGNYVKIEGTYSGPETRVSFRLGYLDTTKYDYTDLNLKYFLISGQNVIEALRYGEITKTSIAVDLKDLTPGNSYSITIGIVFYEGSTAPTTFSPYANICKITAFSTGSVEVEDEDEQSTTYVATFTDPIYQGSIDYVAKKTTATWGYIAEYDGETLPGLWISDQDEYAAGTTPTTGAEVAYELANGAVETVTVSNAPVSAVHGYNKIESSTGDMEVTYITEDFEPLVPTA